MKLVQKTSWILTALLLAACSANTDKVQAQGKLAENKIETIDIQVIPYYSAYKGKVERISVHKELDPLLATGSRRDHQLAVKWVEENPQYITPMTMLVLAARSYDFGQRDEAVKWFYRAQNRLITTLYVLDLPKMNVAEYTGFARLIGDFITPYAFCDFAKQRNAAADAIKWTKANPYQALLLAEMPSKYQDRKKALSGAEAILDKRLAEQDTYFSNPQNKQNFIQKRQEKQTDRRFCW